MEDLRKYNKPKSNSSNSDTNPILGGLFKRIKSFFYKNYKKIIIAFLLFNIIFNPIMSATLIGNWINDFIVTIINIVGK